MNLTDLEQLGWRPEQNKAMPPWEKKGFKPGRVLAASRNFCTLLLPGLRQESVSIPGRLHHQARKGGQLPVVGDWVVYRPGTTTKEGVVESVLPRHTCITRQAAGRRDRIVKQVIGSNIDTVLIVTDLDQDYNLRRIERYFALVAGSGAMAVVLLNKSDLCEHPEQKVSEVQALGEVDVYVISAKAGQGLEQLDDYLSPGHTVAMLGSSGTGKSTLANQLLGENRQMTGELSDYDGKGRHTTTHRELLLLPGGAFLMDNPGIRELQLLNDETDLGLTFEEIALLGRTCRFHNCRHDHEPDCMVKKAVAEGQLDEERYLSFLKLQQELSDQNRY